MFRKLSVIRFDSITIRDPVAAGGGALGFFSRLLTMRATIRPRILHGSYKSNSFFAKRDGPRYRAISGGGLKTYHVGQQQGKTYFNSAPWQATTPG